MGVGEVCGEGQQGSVIEKTIHICTTSTGGMNVVVNGYVKHFGLPKENYWSSHGGSFTLSLFKIFFICIRILFNEHEIYHLHLSEGGSVLRKFIIGFFIRLKRKKYIVHLHGRNFQSLLSKNLLSNSNAIICITEQMKGFIIENLGIKKHAFVIPNICETIAERPMDLSEHKESIKIAYCGTFIKSKGVFDLIEAFEKAKFECPTTLDLFGNGTPPKIQKENINVYGWVEHSEYLRLLQNYDFLALPSKYETFGLAYVEAMGSGLPVIGTFGPAIPEIVKNGETGLLVEFGNIEQLTRALEKLANDMDLRIKLSRNAWQDVKDRFSPQIVLKKLEEMYRSV